MADNTVNSVPQAPDMASMARMLEFLNAAGSLEEGIHVILQSLRAAADADVALVCLGEESSSPMYQVTRAGYPDARVNQAAQHARSLLSALTDPFVATSESEFEWDWKREVKIGEFSTGIIYLAGDAPGHTTPIVDLLAGMMMQFILRFHGKGTITQGVSSSATGRMANIATLTRKVGTQIRMEQDAARISELIRKLSGSDQMILVAKRLGASALTQVYAHPPLPQPVIRQLVHSGLMAAHILGGGDPIYDPVPGSPDEEQIKKMGWKSAAAIPIREFDQVVGGMLLFGFQEGLFTDQTLVNLDPVLMQISSVLAHTELSNELKHTQRQWEVTFDSMDDVVIVADFSGRILRANKALGKRLRIPASTLAGRPLKSVLEIDIAMPEERHSHQMVVDIPRLKGTFTVNVSAVLDTPTSPEAYVIVARDVSQERKREARLSTLAQALDTLPEGVGISTIDGDLVYANPVLRRLLGIALDDASVPLNDQGLFRMLAQRPRWEGEVNVPQKSGAPVPSYVKIAPVLDPQGKPASLVAVLRVTNPGDSPRPA